VCHNHEAGFGRIDIGRDISRALEQQLGHQRVISNRLAIFPHLAIRSFRDPPVQLKLARNYCLREVAFTDKIRHHADFTDRFPIKQKERIAQARFLFPERAPHVCKNLPAPNLRRIRQRRSARVGVHRRAMADDEKS